LRCGDNYYDNIRSIIRNIGRRCGYCVNHLPSYFNPKYLWTCWRRRSLSTSNAGVILNFLKISGVNVAIAVW